MRKTDNKELCDRLARHFDNLQEIIKAEYKKEVKENEKEK